MSSFERAVRTIQFLSVDAVQAANSGHPGTPMALAGIATELFSQHLRYQPDQPNWPNRDRFVLSCGHASALIYSTLHLAGYDLPLEEIKQFRQFNSKTPGHPEFGHTVGVETTTGPLGQGLANAVGIALAGKMAGARVNTDEESLIDYRVYTIVSDGDVMEGVAFEASALAGHWGLDNLIAIYDDNKITIDGTTDLSLTEDVGARFAAAGWSVQRVDGHDPVAVRTAIENAKATHGAPSLIVARTHIGYGAPTMQDTSAAHGSPLGAKEIAGAKEAASWPVEPTFYVPEEAYEPFKAHVAAVKPEFQSWQAAIAKLSGEQKAAYEALYCEVDEAQILAELVKELPQGKGATRAISGTVQQLVAKLVPNLVGGSADLAASVKTYLKGQGDVSAESFSGRNLHFGIREHGMGAITNGIALSGFRAYCSTFLVFSEYMRPTIRMAAMMKLPSIFIYTHDSFFVGEDGPTHQPIEQVSALRLIPGVHLYRPADALECAAAWASAVGRNDGPTILVMTRQDLPQLTRAEGFAPSTVNRGAYVLVAEAAPDAVVMASGSEVQLAVLAQEELAKEGIRLRVVSAPCLEQFAKQDAAYQESVLGKGIRRISIEAGSTGLWRGITGLDGLNIGMDDYGASAPAELLADHFGFTGEKVSAKIRQFLKK